LACWDETRRGHLPEAVKAGADGPALAGATGQAALVVKQLTKRLAERTAFSDVSFQVVYGEVFGFLGPNGAGKTTTVRTLGTLIAPTSGPATVAGIPLSLSETMMGIDATRVRAVVRKELRDYRRKRSNVVTMPSCRSSFASNLFSTCS
jgi:ABC-type oligopeptide transport system ATPase subunit